MRSALAALVLLLFLACSSTPQKPSDIRIDYSMNENGSGAPSYRLTILGNGRVRYEGFHNVGVPGVREYVISQESVGTIVDVLNDGYFFSMPEKVPGIVFDCPVIRIRYSDGHRNNTVIDNCRQEYFRVAQLHEGVHAHSPAFRDDWAKAAKNGQVGLWQISHKIEHLAGAERFVHSNLSDYGLLVTEGWNVNTSTTWGWTALDHAVGRRDYLSATFLLEHGATASDEALVTAALVDDIRCLKLLLKTGHASQVGLNRAATLAARSHDPTALNLLLATGANANADGAWGRPLFEAVRYASGAAIEILVKHGADVNARDTQGNTPLTVAAVGYDSGIVNQLIRLGAQIDARDRSGKTALANAYDRCYYWTMLPLVQAGAALEGIDPQHSPRSCGTVFGDEKAQQVSRLLKMIVAQQVPKVVDKQKK